MDPEQPHEASIIDRINKEGKHLGVSRRELEIEFVRLAHAKDSLGMIALFNAYLAFEQRNSPNDQTQDQIRLRALGNFDYVAEVADARPAGEDDISTFTLVQNDQGQHVGGIRRFYRDAVDYHPEPPPAAQN